MAGFNRFGGGMNMQNMIKQAQKMQAEMERKNQELAETELVGASGGGMVEVVITGKNQIRAVRIKKEAVDPDDVEMLEDLVMAAIKDAILIIEKVKFEELLEPDSTKSEVINVFLAILELLKQQVISIHQEGSFDEIEITKNEEKSQEATGVKNEWFDIGK